MKQVMLSTFIKRCQQLMKNHGDLPCVTSSDDEGNSFGAVWYTPSAGHHEDTEFTPSDDMSKEQSVNCVCLN